MIGAALALLQDLGGRPLLPQQVLPQQVFFSGEGPERARDIVSGIIEVALLTWAFYLFLRFLHGKAGLAVLKGALKLVLGVVLALAALQLLLGISFPRLQYAAIQLLPVAAVMLVVLFQPELRRGFLALAGSARTQGVEGHIADLANSFRALARRRHGALVVFERATGIKGLQDTGVPLDAALSGALIESIFFPKSPMHDGAVIVRRGRLVAAQCMLPLTESTSLSRELGTRHRAALGVTEESDAVAVVVSEETGRISLARGGRLQPVEDATRLEELLDEALEGGEGRA